MMCWAKNILAGYLLQKISTTQIYNLIVPKSFIYPHKSMPKKIKINKKMKIANNHKNVSVHNKFMSGTYSLIFNRMEWSENAGGDILLLSF